MALRKHRIFLRILVVLVIGLLALAAALPLWFGWVLRPAARSLGLSYAQYERDGYSRFLLKRLRLATSAGSFQAQQAEAFIPSVWGWKLLAGETNVPFLQLSSWEFVSQSTSNQTASRSSVYTNFVGLETALGALARWLPRAESTNGSVRVGRLITSVPRASWINGKLAAQAVLQAKVPVELDAEYQGRNALRLSVDSAGLKVRSEFLITNTVQAVQITGVARWLSNRVELDCRFSREDFLPAKASLRADSFEIPGNALKLEDYKDLAGSFRADWSNNRFKVDLTAEASPLLIDLPLISIEAHASGDTNLVSVDAAKITLPWINAELAEGTTFQFTPPFLVQPAKLKVSADLAKQSRFHLTGTVAGMATMFPALNKFPRVAFQLVGNGVTFSNLPTKLLRAEGEFDWPRATLTSARLTTEDGSEVVLNGTWNLLDKSIEQGRVHFAGGFGQKFLPAGYAFNNAELQSEFSGPIGALTHSGTLKLEQLQFPHANPMQLTGEWSGRGWEISQAALVAKAGASSLEVLSSFYLGAKTNEITVSALFLHSSSQGEMGLEKPFQVVFSKSETNFTSNVGWALQMQPLHWLGNGRELSLAADANWPERGNFRVSAENLGSGLVKDFISLSNADYVLDRLALNGGWTNGPLNFALESSARVKTESGYDFSAQASITGRGEGVSIGQLEVTSATQVVGHAEGFLPFFLQPSRTKGLVQVRTNGLLQLRAFTATNSAFWEDVASKSPLRLTDPQVSVEVTGNWAKPQGQVRAVVKRIELRSTKPIPPLDDLLFNLEMDQDQAVSSLNAFVRGQPIVAKAEIPLGLGFWTGLNRERWLPDMREATGELRVQHAQLAPFVDYAPGILSPQGEFDLNVKMERGNQLAGKAILYNAATRPLGTLGPIRAIDAEAVFGGSEVVLTVLTGEIGGQRITATGSAHLDDQFWRARKLPLFQLRLFGTNVPLVRQAGARVRADLNLAITNSTSSHATVSGSVHLHDSFLLSGLQDLAPGKVASVKSRPPYFSIETEPWADWRLNLQVDGEKFLKVQSPVFRGTVSTMLRLEGPLKEPMALGEVRVNSGWVIFPFGSLEVHQGFVSLTSDTLYHPQLFVSATGQRMGYDLRLEVTGPADKPILQFSSSPPLSSEQIVSMLTTGQVPQGLVASSTGRRAQGIALFMGKSFLSDLGIGGAGEERLSVRSGEQVTEAGKPTYEVEYKINDVWSLIGEYDRFSQYNLSFKWKVYAK